MVAMLAVLWACFWVGVMGEDGRKVFEQLCQIVEETIDLYHQDGKPLSPPTSGRDIANKMLGVAGSHGMQQRQQATFTVKRFNGFVDGTSGCFDLAAGRDVVGRIVRAV